MGMRSRAVVEDARQMDFFSFAGPSRAGVVVLVSALDTKNPPVPPAAPLPERGTNSRNAEGLSLPPVPVEVQTHAAPESPKVAAFHITDTDRVGEGSLRQKAKANLQALEILKQLDNEGRPATDEERRSLVRYVGWGGLPGVFDERNMSWAKEREQLTGLLSDEEFSSARATTLNAHYTSPTIIRAMYGLLERLGFKGGRVLEPACGIGHFLGLMPEAMRSRSTVTAIEIDGVTARIAQALYPEADVRHAPFEDTKLADDFYDVAISNIPFGDYRPFDARFKSWNFLIHDYFFAAALTKVRLGGLVVFITSKGTLDKADSTLREHLDRTADFLGAIRLPNDAFKKNANTEVTTDIVVLRKRLPGEVRAGSAWKELGQHTNALGEEIPLNEWFAAHPELMLGELKLSGRMYRQGEPTLVSNGRDLSEQLAEAIQHLPAGVYAPVERPPPTTEPTSFPAPSEVKPNAFMLVNGQLARREGDALNVLTELSPETARRLRGLIRVRDAIRECLRTQWENQPEEAITNARLVLNQAYDHFVGKFGPLSDRRNTAAFRGDPDLPLLLSVVHYDRERGRATKAALFHERTITKRAVTAEVTDAKSALLVTLNECGRVDIEFLGELLRQAPDEFLPQLKGLVFLNPQTRTWETDDDYLSGDVKTKLSAAEAAALTDPKYREHVEALQSVQPADLSATEIDARLGSTWLPPEDVARFAEQLLGEDGIDVQYAPLIGTWVVRGQSRVRMSVANTAEWGTERRGALELLEDALNLRTPTVYDHDPKKDRPVINGPATESARDKQQKIKERFQEWVWRDDERRERLLRLYNDRFNCVRLRTFNGDHLALPGASSAVDLRFHQ